MSRHFDSEAFRSAIDDVRQDRGFTWKDVARESAVNASSLSRMASGKNLDVNGIAALITWSGIDMMAFLPDVGPSEVDTVVEIAKLLRADKKLSHKHKDLIQNFVKTAYHALQTN